MNEKSTKNFVQTVVSPGVNKEQEERIAERIRKVRGEGSEGLEWNQDTVLQDIDEVFRIVEDWEDNIAPLDDKIASLTGEAGSMHFRDEILSDLKVSQEELRSKRIPGENDNYTVGVKEVADKYQFTLDPLRVEARSWKASQNVVKYWGLKQAKMVISDLLNTVDALQKKVDTLSDIEDWKASAKEEAKTHAELEVLRNLNGTGVEKRGANGDTPHSISTGANSDSPNARIDDDELKKEDPEEVNVEE